jgi:hypothetical protein
VISITLAASPDTGFTVAAATQQKDDGDNPSKQRLHSHEQSPDKTPATVPDAGAIDGYSAGRLAPIVENEPSQFGYKELLPDAIKRRKCHNLGPCGREVRSLKGKRPGADG